MQDISYEHALDETGRIVNTSLALRGGSYTCPNCKQRLIFRAGEVRQRHFAHKGNACEPETYLHQGAELALGQELENRTKEHREFYILVRGILQQIEAGTGRVVSTEYTQELHQHNILSNEPSISIEARVNGFIPDICIKSDSQIYFVEICVTNPVSEEKIASGIPIIQFKIESESDIERLIEGNLAENSQMQLYNFDIFRPIEKREVPAILKSEPLFNYPRSSALAEQRILDLEPINEKQNPKGAYTPGAPSKYMPIRFKGQYFPSRVRHLYYGGNEIVDLSKMPDVEVEGKARAAGSDVEYRFKETIEDISKKSKIGKLTVVYIEKIGI